MSLTDYNYGIAVLNLKELRKEFELVTIATHIDFDGRRVYSVDLCVRIEPLGQVRPLIRYIGHDLPYTLQKAAGQRCRWSHRTV